MRPNSSPLAGQRLCRNATRRQNHRATAPSTGCSRRRRRTLAHRYELLLRTYLHRDGESMAGTVLAVSRSATHSPSKGGQLAIQLLAGLGVADDAHAGVTVQHRSRVARDPSQPNQRQVHLIHTELHEELRERGFEVAAGQMGENITTHGIDLLGL